MRIVCRRNWNVWMNERTNVYMHSIAFYSQCKNWPFVLIMISSIEQIWLYNRAAHPEIHANMHMWINAGELLLIIIWSFFGMFRETESGCEWNIVLQYLFFFSSGHGFGAQYFKTVACANDDLYYYYLLVVGNCMCWPRQWNEWNRN